MPQRSNLADLDKLKARIQALRTKTIGNGCTEDEALSAAAKVAELLDRYDLSLTDLETREAPCERLEFETRRKKRIPIEGCIIAVAHFCDCRVWRERNQSGEARYVFFGLRSDIAFTVYLTGVIDTAIRTELGRYKTSLGYGHFRHKERHMANSSFVRGMATSIADKLMTMKGVRDDANRSTGRDLVILKRTIVDAELEKLDLNLRTQRGATRIVSAAAYQAGSIAGASLAINQGIGEVSNAQAVRKHH